MQTLTFKTALPIVVTTVVAKNKEFEKLQLGFEAAVLLFLISSNFASIFSRESDLSPSTASLMSKCSGKICFPCEVFLKVCKNKATSSLVLCSFIGLYSIDSKINPPMNRKPKFAKNRTNGTRFFRCVGVKVMPLGLLKFCPICDYAGNIYKKYKLKNGNFRVPKNHFQNIRMRVLFKYILSC